MFLTTNPNDPELKRGVDSTQVEQSRKYLILSQEERDKGFVRPIRKSYTHVGPPGLRCPMDGVVVLGSNSSGCGRVTTMALEIAETYARDPKFYGSTYCCECRKHLPVNEFFWVGTTEEVGS